MKKLSGSILLLLGILFQSCLNQVEKPTWDSQILTPIAKTSINFDDLAVDSITRTQADSSVLFVYQDTIYQFELHELVDIEFDSFERTLKLDQITLGNQVFGRSVTLGEITRNMGTQGTLIRLNHGNYVDIPDAEGQSIDPESVNANDLFETITFEEGTLEITIDNNFPVDIENIEYELRNSSDGSSILSGSFAAINSGQSESQTVDLAGRTIESNLEMEITNFDIVGQDSVLIDTTDNISTEIRIYDILVQEATAIFPAQNLIDASENAPLSNMGALELENAVLKQGTLEIDIISTAEDSIYFSYEIPDAVYQGESFLERRILPPAPPDGTSEIHENIELDKPYDVDLRGINDDTINSMYNHIIGRIDSTGRLVHLSLQDSIDLIIQIREFIPREVEGYIGWDTIMVGPEEEHIGIFEKIQDGSVKPEQVSVDLQIVNGMGFRGAVNINEMVALNKENGEERILESSQFDDDINVGAATRDGNDNINAATRTINLNENNSNINEIFEILPRHFAYNLDIFTYQDGMGQRQPFFADESKGIYALFNAEIPLSFTAENIVMRDTVHFSSEKIANHEQLKDGTFKFLIDNYFPLSASMELFFIDENGATYDTIRFDNSIQAAESIDGQQITTPQRTSLEFYADNERIFDLINAHQLAVKFIFSTPSQNEPVKIYNNYRADFQLVGDFNYTN